MSLRITKIDRLGHKWEFIPKYCRTALDSVEISEADIAFLSSQDVVLLMCAVRDDYIFAKTVTKIWYTKEYSICYKEECFLDVLNRMIDRIIDHRLPRALFRDGIKWPKPEKEPPLRDYKMLTWSPTEVQHIPQFSDKIDVHPNLVYIGSVGSNYKENFSILQTTGGLFDQKLNGYARWYANRQQGNKVVDVINHFCKGHDIVRKKVLNRLFKIGIPKTDYWRAQIFRDALFGVPYNKKRHIFKFIYNELCNDAQALIDEGVTLVLITSPWSQQTLYTDLGFGYVAVLCDEFKVPYDIISSEEYDEYRRSIYSDFSKYRKYLGKPGINHICLDSIDTPMRNKIDKFNDAFGTPDGDLEIPRAASFTPNDSYKCSKFIERTAYAATDDEYGASGAHMEPMLGSSSLIKRYYSEEFSVEITNQIGAVDCIVSGSDLYDEELGKLRLISRDTLDSVSADCGVYRLKCPVCGNTYRSVHASCTQCGFSNLFYDKMIALSGYQGNLNVTFEWDHIKVGEDSLELSELSRIDLMIIQNNLSYIHLDDKTVEDAIASARNYCSDERNYDSDKDSQAAKDWDELDPDYVQDLMDQSQDFAEAEAEAELYDEYPEEYDNDEYEMEELSFDGTSEDEGE